MTPPIARLIGRSAVGRDDAVQEQRDLAAFAQDGDADHHGQRQQRLGAVRNGLADRAHFPGDFPAVMRHPDIVPGQHDHGDAEDCRVEQLLSHAREQLRQGTGERRDEAGRKRARQHPAADPAIAMRHRAGHREHDADDQSGFEYFAEHDDEGGQHGYRLLHGQSAARLFVEVVIKFVASGFQRPHIDDALAVGGDHLLDPQRRALELHRLGVEILTRNEMGLSAGALTWLG